MKVDEEEAITSPGGEDQPRWRRDFPIDWAEDDYVARRDLVKFLVLVSGAFATGQLWMVSKLFSSLGSASVPFARLRVAGVDELPVGEAKVFHYPPTSSPRLLVRTGPDSFVAYSQQCTHLLCPVIPAVPEGRLHCPCHEGWFDLDSGQPLAGPPRRPLARVLLEVEGSDVFAVGLEGEQV